MIRAKKKIRKPRLFYLKNILWRETTEKGRCFISVLEHFDEDLREAKRLYKFLDQEIKYLESKR